MEKIVIKTNNGISEWFWAKKIDDNIYRLENSPFEVYGYSWNDLVEVKKNKDNQLEVSTLYKKGGYSIYRILLKIDFYKFEKKYWDFFKKRNCAFEGADDKLLSISIPIKSQIDDIYQYLLDGEKEDFWVFEEVNFEHLSKKNEKKEKKVNFLNEY